MNIVKVMEKTSQNLTSVRASMTCAFLKWVFRMPALFDLMRETDIVS
jgi:hypothetical protein